MVKVLCRPVPSYALNPGDLYSLHGPEFWKDALDGTLKAVPVFIRSNYQPDKMDDQIEKVYRIELMMGEEIIDPPSTHVISEQEVQEYHEEVENLPTGAKIL